MSKENIYGKRENGNNKQKAAEKRRKGKNTERFVARKIRSTHLVVDMDPPPIRCNPPIHAKNGKIKCVTLPDLMVIDSKKKRDMYLEVTCGNGRGGHKKAQQMVAEAAGVENYFTMNGEHISRLENTESPEEILNLLFEWFGWD